MHVSVKDSRPREDDMSADEVQLRVEQVISLIVGLFCLDHVAVYQHRNLPMLLNMTIVAILSIVSTSRAVFSSVYVAEYDDRSDFADCINVAWCFFFSTY
jgi:hypothetical protein